MYYSAYVGHLPIKTTKADLMELFAAYRPKEVVVLNRENSSSFSYGFVRFDNLQAVVEVIKEGDWRLHETQLTVKLSKESNGTFREVMVGKNPTSKAFERDSLVRSRVKESCRLVNKEVDVMNGEEPLDATWVLSHMESCRPKYSPKLTGTPDPSCILTPESFALLMEPGPFSSGDPEEGVRRGEEVMNGVRTLLMGLHATLQESIGRDKEHLALRFQESEAIPNKKEPPRRLQMPKNVISVMEAMGMNEFSQQRSLKGGTALGESLDGIRGADNRSVREKHDDSVSGVQTQLHVGAENMEQKTPRAQRSSNMVPRSSEQTRLGKGQSTKADNHHLQSGGRSGPGGPHSRESPRQRSIHSRTLRQPETCGPDHSIPGGPPSRVSSSGCFQESGGPSSRVSGNCHFQESVDQSHLQGAFSISSGMRQVPKKPGKASYKFSGKNNSIDGEEPGNTDSSRMSAMLRNHVASRRTYGDSFHVPDSDRQQMIAGRRSVETVARVAELDSAFSDLRVTASSSHSHLTDHSYVEKTCTSPSNLRGQSTESSSPSPDKRCSPMAVPPSPSGVGRGAMHLALLESLLMLEGEKVGVLRTEDCGTAGRASPAPSMMGRGRGALKALQLLKK